MTNIAICGLGSIGSVHLDNLLSLRGCRISGVFDVRAEPLDRAARTYGVRAFPDMEALLEDSGTDAVVIATPASTHHRLVSAAIEKDKHVFVEKPIASSLKDAEAIVDAAKRSTRKVQVGFCERFNPQFLEAHQAVRRGALGVIRAIYSSRIAPLSLCDPGWDLGIFDTAVHNIDLILWLLGQKPALVRTQGVRLYEHPPVVHSAVITMQFPEGAFATDHITWLKDDAHPLHQCARARLLVLGDKGAFEVDLSQRPSSVLTEDGYRAVDSVILGGTEYYGCLKLQFESFLRAIEEDKPVAASAQDALLAEEVVLAASQSLQSGEEVTLT